MSVGVWYYTGIGFDERSGGRLGLPWRTESRCGRIAGRYPRRDRRPARRARRHFRALVTSFQWLVMRSPDGWSCAVPGRPLNGEREAGWLRQSQPAVGWGGAFPAGPKRNQADPRKTKEIQGKLRLDFLGFPRPNRDFSMGYGAAGPIFFRPWSASRAPRTYGGLLSQKRSVHMSNSGKHYTAMAGRRPENCSEKAILSI